MSARTPAELKELFESDTFARDTNLHRAVGAGVYPFRHAAASVGTYSSERVCEPLS